MPNLSRTIHRGKYSSHDIPQIRVLRSLLSGAYRKLVKLVTDFFRANCHTVRCIRSGSNLFLLVIFSDKIFLIGWLARGANVCTPDIRLLYPMKGTV